MANQKGLYSLNRGSMALKRMQGRERGRRGLGGGVGWKRHVRTGVRRGEEARRRSGCAVGGPLRQQDALEVRMRGPRV